MPARAATVLLFAPEFWGQVELFSKLCSETYKFNERAQRALAGVGQHFNKAITFQKLAVKLRPNLAIDEAELNEHGCTPAMNSRELARLLRPPFSNSIRPSTAQPRCCTPSTDRLPVGLRARLDFFSKASIKSGARFLMQ